MRLHCGFPSLGALRTDLCQAAHAHQVVGGHGQHKHLVHTLEAAHHHLANAVHGLGPAKALLNQFALALRNRITLNLGDLIGDGRFPARGVLRHMRRDVHRHAGIDELLRVVALVGNPA
jgi:hypothetical protein